MKNIWIRIFSIMLCLIMAFSFPAFAEKEEKENFIKNGGFEEKDEMDHPVDWTPMGNDWDGAASLTTETAYEGDYSLKIENNGQYSHPWVRSKIYGLAEGGLYEINGKIKTERLGTNTFIGLKMEAYDTKGDNFFGEDVTEPFREDTVGQWVDLNAVFTIPDGTHYILIYARLYNSTGIVYFDNMELTMADQPDKYVFNVNSKIQYADSENGAATLNVHSYYEGQNIGNDTMVEFSVTDTVTGETVDAQSVSSMPDDTVTYTYPLAKLTQLKREYEVKAVAKDKSGNVIGTYSDMVAKFKRPERLTKDGRYVVNGKTFYPNIGYHVDTRDYPRMAELGINVVQMSGDTGTIEASLAEAAKYGMMGLIMMYSGGVSGGHPSRLADSKTMIEVIKDNENVFAVIPQDEPFIVSYTQEMKDQLWNFYKTVRAVDDDVPVYIVDAMNRYFYEDVKFCDICYSENYTAGVKASSMAMAQADAAKKADKFFGILAGVHGYNTRPFPTADDVRDSIYRSFPEGIGGIGYYAISDADHETGAPLYRAAPDTWNGIAAFAKNEEKELFDYYVEKKYETFGRFYPRTADGLGSYSEAWVKDEKLMLVVHNHSLEEKTFTLPLTSGNGLVSIGAYRARPIGGASEEISGNGSFTITLSSNQAVLYEVTPEAAVDFSALAKQTDGKNYFAPVGSEFEQETEEAKKPSGIFGDLEGYDWAKEEILSLYEKGVVNDKNVYAFAPGENITRADFVTFLVRALGIAGEGEAFPDCDIPEVLAAKAAGVVLGDTDGNFRPDAPITRQDVFTISARSVKLAEPNDTVKAEAMFTDWNTVSDYAKKSMAALAKADVVRGNSDGTVNPLGFTTRAEAAVLIHRLQNTDFDVMKEEQASEEAEEEKEEITFSDTPSAETLEKWNEAASFVKNVGIGEISVDTSVTKGEFEALIKALTGAEYNVFEEKNKALLFSEATEALVKLLGYEVYTKRDGGFQGVAARIDLTKGIKASNAYIRGGELACLLKNAADIYLCETASFGADAEQIYEVTDETLLSAYKNIYKYEGVIEENYFTSDSLKATQIIACGEVFEGGTDYIGQKVIIYAEHGEDKVIRHITPRGNMTITKLDANDIVKEKTTDNTLCYEAAHETFVSVTGAKLIKNGRYKTNWTAADLTPATGDVTIISHSGDAADYILVRAFENRIIEKVLSLEEQITFKEGESITLDMTAKQTKQSVVRTNGQAVTIAAMSEYHVLSIAESEDKKVRQIIFSNKTVSGEVTEVSDNKVTIDDAEYEIAENLRTSKKLTKPTLGQTAKFCLDYAGKIAAVNNTVSGRNYGYFTTAELGKGLNGKLTFRIFTRDGEMKYFEATEKVLLNGVPSTGAEIMGSGELFAGERKPIGQLVVYKLNADGKLSEIQTALDKREVSFLRQGDIDEFALVASPTGTSDAKETMVQYYKIGSKYRFNSGTAVFLVPADYSEREEDYGIGDNKIILEHSTNIGAAKYYDLSRSYYLSAIVLERQPSTTTIGKSPYGVVTGHVETLGKDGMPSKGIKVVNNIGEEMTLSFPAEDFDIEFGEKTLTNISKDTAKTEKGKRPKYIKPAQLMPGDIVQWELNAMTDEVSAMVCIFRNASMPEAGTVWPSSLAGAWGEHYNYDEQFFGYFKAERVFELGFATTKPHTWLFNFWSVNTRYAVLVYEKETGRCYKIDYSDVRENENIVYACWAYMMQLGVVYR